MPDFKYIVVGAGMMGAAAARHLSAQTDGVALIGPDEPADRKTHTGVFSSHYDEARITRGFDGDPVWAELAQRSIRRYTEIEAKSGIRFFTEAGCLFTGNGKGLAGDYVSRALSSAGRLGLGVETIGSDRLVGRFAMFSLPADHNGYFEARNAGHVNPRALVKAQCTVAAAQGARLVRETAAHIRDTSKGVEVSTREGAVHTAEKVIVAAGGFTNMADLLPSPVDMAAAGRTIAFFELDDARQALFGTMPSTIVLAETEDDIVYILPPVHYPDGKVYLKIGGESEKGRLETLAEAIDWFHSDGTPGEVEFLKKRALSLMPELAGCPVTSGSCVASITRSGYPYIGYTQSSNIAVLTGGNFVSAKSSDEIGRLGAVLLLDGQLTENDFAAEMSPVFI
ncbi:FAD-dependent oxidoreductase [Rhizobium oryzihabitans]|uniref:FAD-dependent oxidoreductase n=1 Tax=Rhizobium oryzihabitans TaxID=2267833 RepID=A0A7L5BK90_9HYPH|nr:FAD-dependent oxidoreductase [Rhizobium oryzihabitans]QCM05418.1 FAD-dependent oxidoreductase [Agrobacterium tumefaciens]QIB39206.1 FAD-dependent oxidoreductase [Rhizobium oryzihabitans]CUX25038.1 Sarcosine oxidase [Agrobacterium genomosp. 5 str. CFBP 6626]